MEFHTQYRPKSFDGFIGHKDMVTSVCHALDKKISRCFLFTGEVGLGKTTVARLIAYYVGVDPNGPAYTEYDGATNTGVDDMRAILEMARLHPLGGSKKRVIVIDECQQLTKSAWNSALKSIEEPPAGVHWIFCTSEGSKVPASIRSRCHEHVLGELQEEDISEILESVIEGAGVTLQDEIFGLLLDHAMGNPRRALIGLGRVLPAKDLSEAQRLLSGTSMEEGGVDVIDFCRALTSPHTGIKELVSKVNALQGKTTAEGIRNVVCSYFTKAASGKNPGMALNVLKAFGTPYPPGLGQALYPVLVSIASVDFDD